MKEPARDYPLDTAQKPISAPLTMADALQLARDALFSAHGPMTFVDGCDKCDRIRELDALIMDAKAGKTLASEKSESGDAYKEAVEQNLRLRKALEQSVRVCRQWHAMPQRPGPGDAFDIYFNHSPEMKLVRDALGKMPEEA